MENNLMKGNEIMPMNWWIKKPNTSLYITCIGAQGVGKTTLLCMLAEMLYEDKIDFSYYKKEAPTTVVLVDELKEEEFLIFNTRKDKISLRLRRQNSPVDWTDRVHTDLFLWNDGDMRLLKFQLRDLYNAEIKNHRVWKDRFYEPSNTHTGK